MSDLASELREVAVTLPDGAVRRYPAGVTAAEVAADISKSLEKAALAVTDRRAARRPLAADRAGRGASPSSPRRTRRRAGADPPRRRPYHGAGGAGALAGREGDDRAGDRERLVLRLRPRRAVHARGPRRRSRRGCARSSPRATRCAPRSGTATARSATTRRSGETYKVELVEAIPAADPIRMYWHGPWQDLCRGPHLRNTGQVPADAFKLMSIAGAYWRGDSRRPMLQRIYGVAFRTQGRSQGLPAPARGGGEARPPQARAARWTCSTCSRRRRARSSGTRTGSRSGGCSRPTSAASSTPTAMSR